MFNTKLLKNKEDSFISICNDFFDIDSDVQSIDYDYLSSSIWDMFKNFFDYYKIQDLSYVKAYFQETFSPNIIYLLYYYEYEINGNPFSIQPEIYYYLTDKIAYEDENYYEILFDIADYIQPYIEEIKERHVSFIHKIIDQWFDVISDGKFSDISDELLYLFSNQSDLIISKLCLLKFIYVDMYEAFMDSLKLTEKEFIENEEEIPQQVIYNLYIQNLDIKQTPFKGTDLFELYSFWHSLSSKYQFKILIENFR